MTSYEYMLLLTNVLLFTTFMPCNDHFIFDTVAKQQKE